MFPRAPDRVPRTSVLPTRSAKTSTLIRCWHKASMEKLVARWAEAEPHANKLYGLV